MAHPIYIVAMNSHPKKYFLFSVDLEDVRHRMSGGERYEERVPLMTERYLQFLEHHGMKATFFIVGDVAKNYPQLVKAIVQAGHEVGCHTNKHVPLTEQTRETFRADLDENMEHLFNAGVNALYGFRAPVFSLTESTQWAYEILIELGFVYSSSVLPAKNPLHGWEKFGREFKLIQNTLWELPITLYPKYFSLPCAGGVYLRMLPFWMTQRAFEYYGDRNLPVLSYFHPYDIDHEEKPFMFPDANGNRIFNQLMYINRKSVLGKLEKIIGTGWDIIPYHEYVKMHLQIKTKQPIQNL